MHKYEYQVVIYDEYMAYPGGKPGMNGGGAPKKAPGGGIPPGNMPGGGGPGCIPTIGGGVAYV